MQELITGPEGELPDGAEALHERLAQMVLAGEELDRVATEIAVTLGVGIVVTSTDGRQWAAALEPGLHEALVEGDLLDETGRVRVERLRRGAPLGEGEAQMIPVAAPENDLARLVVLSPGRCLAPDQITALQRAATVAALWITRERAVTAVANKYRGDFLRDVFLGRAGTPEFVLEHAASFGWDLARPMVVVAAQIDPDLPGESTPTQPQRRQWQERFAAAWRQVTSARDATVPCADFSSEVISVLPAGEKAEDTRALVRRTVHAVSADKGGGRRAFCVGVSRVADGMAGLPDAYAQACRAREVGRRVHGRSSTTWFDDLGLHRLIAMIPDTAELDAFVGDVLGALADDGEEATSLRETLQVLLDTNFNVAEAARAQFFHYNTMRYRLGKLERMLGPVGSDPHLRLDVAVALKVLEITA